MAIIPIPIYYNTLLGVDLHLQGFDDNRKSPTLQKTLKPLQGTIILAGRMPPSQLTGSRTLHQTVERSLLADLSTIVEEAKPRATFACSGYIGVSKDLSEYATARPITIRWDSTAEIVDNKLKLPLTSDNQLSSVQNLMKACKQEATGPNSTFADKEIVHPTAVALCPSSFSTDFCPYKYGIIDRVSQMLLVGQGGGKEGPQIPRVRAEIKKLNIYSSTSTDLRTNFERSTPTPLQPNARLIVYLPLRHTGGELAIRYKDREMTLVLNSYRNNHSYIQWAACYSDCEQEMLPIISGNRMTLTYDLVMELSSRLPHISPQYLPVHDSISRMLEQPGFMPGGGILGFYCAHSYIHFYEGPWSASSVLKGVDKALYETFGHLKLKPEIRVILDPDQICHDYSDGPLDEDPPDEYPNDEGGDRTPGRTYRVSVIQDEDIENMHESLVPSFVVYGRPQRPVLAIADDAAHDEDHVESVWSYKIIRGIRWLTEPKHDELAGVWLSNDGVWTSMMEQRSWLALLVKIPPYNARFDRA